MCAIVRTYVGRLLCPSKPGQSENDYCLKVQGEMQRCALFNLGKHKSERCDKQVDEENGRE